VKYIGVIPALSLPRLYMYVSLFRNSLNRVVGYLYAQVRGGRPRTVYVGKVYEGEREPGREEVETAARRLLAEGAPVGALVVALQRAHAEKVLREWLRDIIDELARKAFEERRPRFWITWPLSYDDPDVNRALLERLGEEGVAKLAADALALQHLEDMWGGVPRKGERVPSQLAALILALREARDIIPALNKLREPSKRGKRLREMLGLQSLKPLYRLLDAFHMVGVEVRRDPEGDGEWIDASPSVALMQEWCTSLYYEISREGGAAREVLEPQAYDYDEGVTRRGEEGLLWCARRISGARGEEEREERPRPPEEEEEAGELTVGMRWTGDSDD
jgi:hypothetical protein